MADSEAPLIGGTVSAIEGSAFVRGSDGRVQRLEEGDTVRAGDVIITSPSSSVEIDCGAEAAFVVPEDAEFLATEECFTFEGDASENEVADETIAAVAAALESGGDLLDVLEATAAGGATGNNGHTFIRLGRIVLALSDGSTTTEEELLAALEDVLGQADLLEQSPALVSIIGEYTIVEGDTSGAFVVLLNQAPESVGSDITVTLNYSGIAQDGTDFNGVASVVIPAGSNATAFTIDTIDDALVEGAESFTISIGAITDTNFVTIEADPEAISVTNTIVDDTTAGPEDTALVSIAGEYTIIEGETSGEFTVAVDQPAGDVTSDITVALVYSGVAEDGTDFTGVAEVTIAAGTNTATFSIDTIDDALAEGSESLVISIGEITDTNFEAIAADPNASSVANAIVDETDPNSDNPPDTAYELRLFAVIETTNELEGEVFTSTEYVDALSVAEDGGEGTYVVLAVDENGDPLPEADQPGGTVTVNVGAIGDTADREDDYDSAATVVATVGATFTIAAIDDVFADNNEEFTLGLGEDWSRAGEFEGVVYSGTVTTTILDETNNDPEVPEDNDQITLNIAGPSSVIEGETTTDYTLSLVDADGNAIVAETDIVVTVTYTGTAEVGSDYTSETPITIAAGQSSATFDLATIDDAIADNGETIVLTISTDSDGGFEDLKLGNNEVTTTIIDDDIEPPIALDDAAETGVDASVVINVATNDSDPDGSLDLGSIVITQLPTNGSVVVNGDGTVTYTPNEGYVGPDTFKYTIADNEGAISNVANVAVQVSDGRETAAFTDNWVNGVEYYAYATEEDYLQGNDPVASGLTGDRLDENGDPIMGSFSWADGEFVVFKIGDVIVAEFLAEQLTGDILFIHDIAGLALSNTNADQLENTAIFLQALDADLTDGDLSDGLSTNSTSNSEEAFTNGINISQEVRDAFVGYVDPTTGEALDLQEAGKVMISNALAILGIEFTRQSEVDPNPNDEGGNENVFETQAIEHVTDTVLALADTEEAGERLADDFAFDAREEDIIVAGNGEITYSSELLDTEDGDPETARISFNAAGLVANATPQQVAIVENMEIEIPEGTEAQITLADGTTRVVGTVVYDDETREGYIQLEPFVAGDGTTPDRGITNEEIVSGLLQSGGVSFTYTLWDWTASITVSLDTIDTYRNVISLEGPSEVAEGETTTDYTVSLSQPIPAAEDGGTDIVVTLTYTYRTAEEGDIVETVSVTIPAGSASATFTIDTVADELAEGREDFVVSITETNIQDENFSVVEVSDANSVTTTIIDDGASFSLELFAVVQVEGTDESPEFDYVKASEIAEDGGVAEYVVLLVDAEGNPVLDQPGGTVTINVGVAGDTADRGVDYDSAATVVATVGTTFTIAAVDDAVADNGEVFTLVLAEDWSLADANPAVSYENAPVSTTILDETYNDPEVPEDNDQITLNIAGPSSVIEGETTTDYTLSLVDVDGNAIVAETDIVVTVTYTGTAEDGSDYTAETPITIAAGQSSATFDLATIDDAIADNGETIVLTISTADDGGFESLGVGTGTVTTMIIDDSNPETPDTPDEPDQDPVTLSITGPSSVIEGETTTDYTLSLVDADGNAIVAETDIVVTVTYTGTAEDGSDYMSETPITIAAGQSSATFDLATIDDAIADNGETIVLTISTDSDGGFEDLQLGDNEVTTTIIDDLNMAMVSISGEYTIIEGETSGEFTVSLNQAAEDVTSDITVALVYSGVAEDGTDFTGVAEVTIAAGTNSATFSIDTIDDALAEGSESLVISIGEITDTNFEAIAADPNASSVTNAIVDETDPNSDNPPDTAYELRLFAVIETTNELEGEVFTSTEYVDALSIAEDGGVGTYVVLAVDENGDPLPEADQPGGTVTVNVGAIGDTADRAVDYDSAATVVATVGTTFTIAAIDDVFADNNEVFTLGLGEDWSRAGEFEGVAYSGTVTTTILDETDNDPEIPEDNDRVTISLGDLAVDEGSGNATITGSLDAVPDEEFVVTLDNGATITFGTDYVVGTEVESTPFSIQDDDVFIDAETLALGVTSVTPGVFEAVNTDESAQVVISDTIDNTTVTLASSDVNEGADITITASVDNAPQTDLVVTLSNGETLTILAGATSGTVTFTNPNADDVYVDGETLTYSITGTSGGNYESLNTSSTVDVVVSDTTDDTTLTLNDVTVSESDGGTATITASLDNAPETELVVTLSNGATITFAAGATTATSTAFAINNDEDVYVDGSSFELSVSSTSGGNFENLVTTDTSTVTVNDTTDTTTVTLASSDVNEGADITITASVDNAPQTDLVVTLSNGETLTILAGATSGTVTFTNPNADDVYVDGETLTYSITGTSGGNYESLNTSSTVDVVVSDTTDDTTLTLNDVTVSESDGGTATITASLDNAPETELVVTLSNGATITFAAGATTATSTAFAINNDEDVYVDGSSFELSVSSTSGGNFENLVTTDTSTVTVNDTTDTTTVTLASSDVNEGADITITASVDNAPQTDLVVTLSNGETLTILAGATSGTVTFTNPNADDVYVDGETLTYSITGTSGGNYESLNTSSTVDVVVSDTTDDTTLTLNDVTVSESDGGTATITASLDNAPETELVVTLSNGATITFAAGATTATSTAFAINNDEDVYVDGSSFELSVSSTSGGNFENLVTTDTSTVTVNDTTDTTTVTLASSDVNEGADITITASVDNAPQTDLVVTLSNGETLTILAGATSGTVTFTNPNADDVYVDGETLTYSITGTSGGNYESLNTSSTVDVVVSDTTDDTTLTLNDVTVSESDGGTATITASLDNAPETELVVTLSNGATITFAAGATTATSTAFAINNDEDVYVDGSSFELSVSSTSGGNFENLVTTDTSTVTVNDTTDTTTVTLASSDVNEGADITITASVDNAPQTDLVVTLSNGETLTILAGATSGTVTFTNPNADDVYVDGETLTYSITGTSGGNYESLNTSSTVDVVVSDTTDDTTLTLNDVTVSESDGGTATITASLDNAPETELVVTLSNGATITFAAGATTATSTAFAINNDEDVYVDGSSFELSVSSTSGGNFENLVTTDTSTVTVNDTTDTTTVTLASSDVNEGADITITASVDNAPQTTDLVITLDNGEQITIAVGQTTGSVTFANTGSSGDTLTYAMSGSSGGNYEALDITGTVDVSVTAPLSASADDVLADEDDLVDGDADNQSYTSQISLSDGGAIASAVIDSSTTNNGTWTVSSTGLVTYTLNAAYTHAAGNGENLADNVDSVTITVTDSNGVTAQVTLNADITDDVPVSLTAGAPSSSVVDGSGVIASGDITFDAGADGSAGIVFSGTEGANATNAAGEQLYLSGEPLVLAGVGTDTLTLETADGTVGLIITIVDDGNGNLTYEVDPENGVITNVQDLGQIDFSGFSGGNSDIYAIVDGFTGSTSGLDVVFTAVVNDSNGNNTVNTNANLLGAGSGQDIDFDGTTGDVVTLSLQQGVSVTGNGGNASVNQGSAAYASAISIPVDQIDANATVIVTFTNTADGSTYTATYTIADMTADPSGTYDYIIDVTANDIGFLFNEVEISVGSTDGNSASFKLGMFSLIEQVTAEPVDLEFAVVGSDADGDEISGSISFTLTPASAPIAIDLDGDGVEYLSRDAGINFTDESSGQAVNTAWIAADDGLLVIDANNSGTVDSSSEYVFTEWSESAQTDLEAIAEVFDTNQDGVLDAQDERFDQFAVWQDHDSDGVTDEGELTSLTDLGIESIELTYREDSESRIDGDGDVTVFGQANVNFEDGSTTTAEDVSFAVEAADLLSEEDDLAELLSEESVGERPEDVGPSRADAAAVDIAQLELTLNFEHNESDSFDQHE